MEKLFDFEGYEFNLPKRCYDITKYRNYIDYLQGKEREEEFRCHCFAIFDPKIEAKIETYLKEHPDCECYKQDICIEHLKDC